MGTNITPAASDTAYSRRDELSILFLSPVVVRRALGQTASNEGRLRLNSQRNGVSGTYRAGSEVLSFDAAFFSKRSAKARISRPSRGVLLECVLEGDIITVRMPSGNLDIDIVNKTPFTEAERLALASFSISEDAALARQLLFDLSPHKTEDNKKTFFGFAVMAMLLGEGEIESAANPAAKATTRAGGAKASYLKCAANPSARLGPCHGCCGPGCWGCTGCYTTACLAHDNCVNENGSISFSCDALLQIAIASMAVCYLI